MGNSKFITVVSGLPRSGTSMMMKMLAAGGIQLLVDGIRTPDLDNPRGHYEFERVKKMPRGDVAFLKDAEGKAVKIISELLKYLPHTHSNKILFMTRNLHEIIASQNKMLENQTRDNSQISNESLVKIFNKHLMQIHG